MPEHRWTPAPPSAEEQAAIRQEYPQYVEWVESLTDDERSRVRFEIEAEAGKEMTMRFYVDDRA